MRLLVLVVLLCFLGSVESRSFFTAYEDIPTTLFKCLRSTGMDRIGLTIVQAGQSIKPTDYQNLINALNAEFNVEVRFQPQRSVSVQKHIQILMAGIKKGMVARLWLEISNPYPWQIKTPEQNCDYLQQFIKTLKKEGIQTGIFVTGSSWVSMFHSRTACPEVSQVPLWWQPDLWEDRKPNFKSYTQIGGWKVPLMKLFSAQTICGKYLAESYLV